MGPVRRREGFVSGLTARGRGLAEAAADTLTRSFPRRRRVANDPLPFQPANDGEKTKVDRYWSRHTVRAPGFGSRRSSERYLEWRFAEYPLFREFTGLWGDHSDEVVLDYGCGPGNDLTGLALYTKARRLIGIDVSQQALSLAGQRLALHGVTRDRVQLIHIADSDPALPLDAASVDYAQSLGVIHHTSDPGAVLREIHRVLKPGGRACVMVYNRESVWFHLYTAYERMICDRAFAGLDVEKAFARNTDGEACPIARCYRAEEFIELCLAGGFEAEFVGGYLSRQELRSLEASWAMALADNRLGGEHRQFLRALSFDASGLPMLGGYHAGIGGVYRLQKPAKDGAIVSEPQAS
jgi:SAM-dependent methyltransferase